MTKKDLQIELAPIKSDLSFAEAQRDVFAEALESSLASHIDVERIERKLIEHDGEFKLIKFMLTLLIGGTVALILRSFF